MKSVFGGIVVVAFFVAGSAWALDATPDLDRLVTSSSVWNESAADFMLAYTPMGFGYMSQQRDSAHSVDKRLTFNGQRVWEALVYFETGTIKRVELSVFNRGDSGTMEEATFQQLCKTLSDGLTKWAGNTGNPVEETVKDRASCVTRTHTWIKAPSALQLSWAYVEPRRQNGESMPFRSEFVKVILLRINNDMQVVKDSTTVDWMQGASTLSIKKHVKKSDSGDVGIDGFPMVDQGKKGYCAAASAERMLRYYGRSVDQHQIAQLADTAAKEGTSQDGMIKALEAIGQHYSMDFKALIGLDWKRLSHLVDEYNTAARGAGKPTVELGHVVNVTQLYSEMDAATLRKAKVRQTQEETQFKNHVKAYTAEGVPLVWSCIVGKFPEVPPINPPGTYGHIRMIIGYNDKTSEVLYTDSWGPGHELKRIPFDDAFTMTLGLHVLKPR